MTPCLPIATETAAPSIDRAAINRSNAQHSTGPSTEAGKAKMRFNALQHGLYSDIIVLPHEDQEAYRSLGERFTARYAPVTDEERELVQTLHDTQWRLSRIASIESGILAVATAEHLDHIAQLCGTLNDITAHTLAQAAGFRTNARTLDQLGRHEARLRRFFDRTAKQLEARIVLRDVSERTGPRHSHAVTPAVAAPPAPKASPVDQSTVGSVPSVSVAPAAAAPKPNLQMPKFSGPQRKEHRKQWLRKHGMQQGAQNND